MKPGGVDVIAKGRITEVINARLPRDADVHNEVMEIYRREDIRTGHVRNIVGDLRKARLSMPLHDLHQL